MSKNTDTNSLDSGLPYSVLKGSKPLLSGVAYSVNSLAHHVTVGNILFDIGLPDRYLTKAHKDNNILFLSQTTEEHTNGLLLYIKHHKTKGCTVYAPSIACESLQNMLDAQTTLDEKLNYSLVPLSTEPIPITNSTSLTPFEITTSILGFRVTESKQKMKTEYANMAATERKKLLADENTKKEMFSTELTTTIVYYPGKNFHALEHALENTNEDSTLFIACPALQGQLPDRENELTEGSISAISSHLQSCKFNGNVVLTHLPNDLIHCVDEKSDTMEIGECDLLSYASCRINSINRQKLSVLPYRTKYETMVINSRVSTYKAEPCQYKPIEFEELPQSEWKIQEFIGFIGNSARKVKIFDRLKKEHPNGFELAYLWYNEQGQEIIVTRKTALRIFEDSYEHFFKQNPRILDWLCETASDVYDYDVKNCDASFDYDAQDGHIQDIAVRRVVCKRFNRDFKGKRLVQVRGYKSEAYVLNPGQIPFHIPNNIRKPEAEVAFLLKGSLESWWQSNKIVVTKI